MQIIDVAIGALDERETEIVERPAPHIAEIHPRQRAVAVEGGRAERRQARPGDAEMLIGDTALRREIHQHAGAGGLPCGFAQIDERHGDDGR